MNDPGPGLLKRAIACQFHNHAPHPFEGCLPQVAKKRRGNHRLSGPPRRPTSISTRSPSILAMMALTTGSRPSARAVLAPLCRCVPGMQWAPLLVHSAGVEIGDLPPGRIEGFGVGPAIAVVKMVVFQYHTVNVVGRMRSRGKVSTRALHWMAMRWRRG